jgi:hypothetical protein
MKKLSILSIALASLLTLALVFVSCNDGSTPGSTAATDDPLVLTGISGDSIVTVKISQTNPSKAVLTPKGGEFYEIKEDNVLISKGKISITGNRWWFIPSSDSPCSGTSFFANYRDEILEIPSIPDTDISNLTVSKDGDYTTPAKPDLTGTVTINNTSPKVGNTLTATYSGGNGSGTATWKWLSDGTAINGSNSGTYIVAPEDAGKTLRAQVSYANQNGNIKSAATAAVQDDRPALTGTVAIDKTSPKVGDTLTATYTPGNGTGTAAWQWFRGDTAISGKTASTYTVVAEDADKTLKAQITYTGQKGSVASVATSAVQDNRPALTGTVAINNTSPKVGDTLTATYTPGNGTGTAAWQWFRGDTAISDKTSSTYTVVAEDVGKTLKAQITYTGQKNSVTSTATSAVQDNRPALTGTVAINNTSPKVGDTLTATYSGGNGTGTATWQWFRGDTAIPDKTSNTYTVVTEDVGKTLKAQVGFANQSGNVTSPATSACTVATTNTKITISAIPGVTPPKTGETPVTTIEETAQYTGTVTWSANDSPFTGSQFAVSTKYTATITLTPKTGFTLQGVAASFFTVSGTQGRATNAASSGIVTAVFPTTVAIPGIPLTIVITPPSETPLTPIVDGTYTERVTHFNVAVSGFTNAADANGVGLNITTVTGLLFSGYELVGDATGNTKNFNVTVTYNGTQVFSSSPVTITIKGLTGIPSGYANPDPKTTSVYISCGQNADSAIPVKQSNIEEFNNYARTKDGLKKHYKLTENITLTLPAPGESNWTAIGNGAIAEGEFSGSFDGDGHTISNLTINTSADYQGLIGYVYGANNFGLVKNVGLIGGSITGKNYVGGIVGCGGNVQHSYTTGSVTGNNYVGGIAGEGGFGVYKSYTTGNVTGNNYVGGIVGHNGRVYECYTTGNITGKNSVGGIVGASNNGTVSKVDFTALTNVYSCYATGTVKGEIGVGGIVGYYDGCYVANCYATNMVEGTVSVGGIAGCNESNYHEYMFNSVALNPKVISSNTLDNAKANQIGRIIALPTTFSSDYSLYYAECNYSRSDMKVLHSYNGISGIEKIIDKNDPDYTKVDGLDIGPENYSNKDWWQTAAIWTTTNNTPVWDFTNIWEWSAANNLPILRNVGGTQNHTVP